MMKVLKWEIEHSFSHEKENELLENGWEPFACNHNGCDIVFRRPVGYIEVEERVIKNRVFSEPVITKEESFNLDKIEKYEKQENQVSEPEISGNCKNTEDGIEY